MTEFEQKLLGALETICEEFSEMNVHLQGIEDAMYEDEDDGDDGEDGETEEEEEIEGEVVEKKLRLA